MQKSQHNFKFVWVGNRDKRGEKELTDISKAVKFVSKKIDESKKDILEKEKPINDLKSKASSLSGKIKI